MYALPKFVPAITLNFPYFFLLSITTSYPRYRSYCFCFNVTFFISTRPRSSSFEAATVLFFAIRIWSWKEKELACYSTLLARQFLLYPSRCKVHFCRKKKEVHCPERWRSCFHASTSVLLVTNRICYLYSDALKYAGTFGHTRCSCLQKLKLSVARFFLLSETLRPSSGIRESWPTSPWPMPTFRKCTTTTNINMKRQNVPN